MVPNIDEPPVVPFTDQVTAALEVPETTAMNWNVSPARMLAVDGETETWTPPGGGGGGGCLFGAVVAAHPAKNSDHRTTLKWSRLRIFICIHPEPFNRAISLGEERGRGYWTEGQKWDDGPRGGRSPKVEERHSSTGSCVTARRWK